MSYDRKVCVTCKYEDASKTKISPTENGVSIWCNNHQRFIGSSDRQGMRKKTDGTFEENDWCSAWVHY